jgi:hypothetical protein
MAGQEIVELTRAKRSDHAPVGMWRVRVNGWAVWHLNPAIWEAIAGTGWSSVGHG